jgi:cell division protein FtsN
MKRKKGRKNGLFAGISLPAGAVVRVTLITLLALVSSSCFALGYLVGKATGEKQVMTEIIRVTEEPQGAATVSHDAETEGLDRRGPRRAQGHGTYTVQIGAFTGIEDAYQVKDTYAAKGYAPYVLTTRAEGKVIYRVRVGTFDNRSDARRMALKLKSHEDVVAFVTTTR